MSWMTRANPHLTRVKEKGRYFEHELFQFINDTVIFLFKYVK